MPVDRISDLAAQRARDTLTPGALEATVLTAPATSLDYVYVALDGETRVKRGPYPWVSNGRLPAVGDGVLLVTGQAERWAFIWASGPVITE